MARRKHRYQRDPGSKRGRGAAHARGGPASGTLGIIPLMSAPLRRVEWHLLVLLSLASLASLTSCSRTFRPRDFANPEALFRASVEEFQKREWENARIGFERLAADLSARDPLLAPAYFYLAMTHEQQKDFLLAAQAYERIVDGFPGDSLAPRAMLGMGRSYQSLWRRPTLDPEYGYRAVSVLRSLLTSYPEATAEIEDARVRIQQLDEQFAQKDYLNGMHYVRVRGAEDAGILYFKDVVTTYPDTKAARLSWLKLHEIYEKKRWKEDVAETCQAMWARYPEDPAVLEACGPAKTDTLRSTQSSRPPETVPVPDAFARPGPQ